MTNFQTLSAAIAQISSLHRFGAVSQLGSGRIQAKGLSQWAEIGQQVEIGLAPDCHIAEVVAVQSDHVTLLPYDAAGGIRLNDPVKLTGVPTLRPAATWLGRVVDAFGRPLDNQPISHGTEMMQIKASAPRAFDRKGLGARVATGMPIIDTMLPLARGQRIGLFAGSGVGKSSLLAQFANSVESDVVVLALIGERGRELRDFLEKGLNSAGRARTVTVVATADESPLVKRRALWTAMTIAEFFRNKGEHVLFLADSITRFAEAHREIALNAGEAASLRAFPPSTGHLISALAERAGPGENGQGDITAVMSVLVAGSDMEEPIADMTRGVLDGHIVLDRDIAERGRFPAINLLKSVSRSLPDVASDVENAIIRTARQSLGRYEAIEPMLQSGLYTAGSDPLTELAIRFEARLDEIFMLRNRSVDDSFTLMSQAIEYEDGAG